MKPKSVWLPPKELIEAAVGRKIEEEPPPGHSELLSEMDRLLQHISGAPRSRERMPFQAGPIPLEQGRQAIAELHRLARCARNVATLEI